MFEAWLRIKAITWGQGFFRFTPVGHSGPSIQLGDKIITAGYHVCLLGHVTMSPGEACCCYNLNMHLDTETAKELVDALSRVVLIAVTPCSSSVQRQLLIAC